MESTMSVFFLDLVNEGLGKVANAAETGLFQSHLLLGLRGKGWILYQAVDENPKLILNVHRFDLRTSSGLLLRTRLKCIHQLVHHMLDVGSAFRRADRVHKGTVLEAVAIRLRHEKLPTLANLCMNNTLAGVEKSTVVHE